MVTLLKRNDNEALLNFFDRLRYQYEIKRTTKLLRTAQNSFSLNADNKRKITVDTTKYSSFPAFTVRNNIFNWPNSSSILLPRFTHVGLVITLKVVIFFAYTGFTLTWLAYLLKTCEKMVTKKKKFVEHLIWTRQNAQDQLFHWRSLISLLVYKLSSCLKESEIFAVVFDFQCNSVLLVG